MFSEINEVALSLVFFFDAYAAQKSCPFHLRVCPQTAYYINDKDTGIAKQSNIKHVIKERERDLLIVMNIAVDGTFV